jgi:hypothetical protein
VTEWCQQVQCASASLVQADARARRDKGSAAQAAVQAARQQLDAVWKQAEKPTQYVQALAAGPLDAEVGYLLALCQHEKAERAQRRLDPRLACQTAALLVQPPDSGLSATVAFAVCALSTCSGTANWKAVAERWHDYLEEFPSSPRAPAAKQLQARALRAQSH